VLWDRFDSRQMQWTSYAEHMEEYLLANGDDNEMRKVAILLSTVGEHQLLGDLCAPDKPNTKTFEELVEKLKNHLQPAPTMIAETYLFHQRSQQKGETVFKYFAALQRLAKNCKFENFIEQVLRD